MRYFWIIILLMVIAAIAGFLFLDKGKTIALNIALNSSSTSASTSTANQNQAKQEIAINKNADIEPQSPLANPPYPIKAIYLTAWTASSQERVDSLIKLVKSSDLNAVVIDIKDYSGYVAYDTQVPEVIKYNAKEVKIPKVNELIKKFHDQGIYVIARITVFQDPRLAKARPELAIQSKSKGTTWYDHKGLAWIDPASQEAWDYNIAIAKDAASRGFDELNFDYVRFASDGDLSDMKFNYWDMKTSKHLIIRNFFKYLRSQLAHQKISADLFGLATVQPDDLGIGQIIEDAYAYFDYVCPMVYPSHYASGFLGYKNPAAYPYEVIKYSMTKALARLNKYNLEAIATSTVNASGTVIQIPAKHDPSNAKLRPWIQDFDLGAVYTKDMIGKELQAVRDSGLNDGWLFWNPSNNYVKEKLPI